MNSLSAIGLSGMNAAWTRIEVSGHNIANHDTTGFRSQEVVLEANAGLSGVSASVRQADELGVSLPKEIVDQMSASYAFKASLKTIETGNSMLGSLLDLHA